MSYKSCLCKKSRNIGAYSRIIAGSPLYLGVLFPSYRRVVMLPGMALMCVGIIFTTQDQIRAGKSLYSYKKWIK